jgi:hypothetical protein
MLKVSGAVRGTASDHAAWGARNSDHGADRSEPAVLLQTERTVISQEDAR